MSQLMLCTAGKSTTIWLADTAFHALRTLPIPESTATVINWNHNNNYILLCSDRGEIYLQSTKKETVMSTVNRIGEETPHKVTCGYVLSGSRLVATGDEDGNIRVWPVSKAGFEYPIINERVPDCSITSIVEAANQIVYMCTSGGHIMEVNIAKRSCSCICQIANECLLSICQIGNSLMTTSEEGRLYRVYPGIKRFMEILESRKAPLRIIKNRNPSINQALLHTPHSIELLTLSPLQIDGVFTSTQTINACDFSADRIALLLDGTCLAVIDTAAMAQPVLQQQLEEPCVCVQFQRVPQSSAAHRLSNPPVVTSQPVVSVPVTPFMTSNPMMASSPTATTIPNSPITATMPNSPLPTTIPTSPITSMPMEHSVSTTPIQERDSERSPVKEESVLTSPVELGRKRTVNPSHADSPSPFRNSEDIRSCVREVMQPMIDDLKVYIHNEILNIKETMVNQITTQEAIIDQQQQCIEMLEQLLQERK
ncbi:hypothetical protein AV274_5393 [Blastocystis sp. ATCC 50177/Nand II]|uniref:Uncharacterized protein n=1 Tax=Blastocystis sp. subtype 1 (strain ATCC 50177 / NandII) TaxID=478820 RepID=A0A196SAA9_BLAHN|nr:hypothetical protein AV274_5393 [Blastocystis sp. ATCC 50177/Nand II]